LVWKRLSRQKGEWQLTDEQAVLAKVNIARKQKRRILGCYPNHEFVMEIVDPPKVPNKLRNRKEFRREYSIKLRELENNSTEDAMKEWGRLEYGLGPCNSPTTLILNDGRTYSIVCYQLSENFHEYSLTTSFAEDKGRIIGITRRARNDSKNISTFQLVRFEQKDPSPILIASVTFIFSTLVHFGDFQI